MMIGQFRVAEAECLLYEELVQPATVLVAAGRNEADRLEPGTLVQLDQVGTFAEPPMAATMRQNPSYVHCTMM